ncbi:MAG: hypothetical protein K2K19_00880 [Acetatifactor sp.]|nr:hypothetical protein [Acetatifactor sp.]
MRKKFLCLAVIASVMLCSCGEHGESGDNRDTPMNSRDMQVVSEQGSVLADIEPEPGNAQADSEPEEEPVVSVASTFRAVLLNEMTFSCSGKVPHSYVDSDMPWEGLLRDQPFGFPEQKTICRFAVVDLDGDTVPEVVLEIEGYYGYLILQYNEGQIYGNEAYYRAMENLRENGAFISSDGAFDNTIEKLFFVGDTYITDSKIHRELSNYGNRYHIDDILISESGHDRVDALVGEIPEVEWHDYTEETVTEFIVENPLFAQLPAELEESIRQRQAYLDSLSYLIELTYKSPEKSPEEEYADAKSYYDGCSKEMEKIYQLCQEKLSGSALEALIDEQQIWERSNGRELRETLRNSNFDSMEKLEERMRLFYLTYGDIALRRTFKLINLYYGNDFFEWVDPTLSEYYGGPEELMGVVHYIEQEVTQDQTADREVLSAMAELTEADYRSAVSYEENSQKDIADAHVVLLSENAADTVRVYGYESEEYQTRGIIVQWDGQKSYFDYCWDRMYGNIKVYEGDYDHDETDELCLCMLGQRGTGVYIERLILLEKNPENGQVISHEFSGEVQQEGIKSKLLHEINADTGVFVTQKEDGQGEVILELTPEEAAGDKAIEIDCFNQVRYWIEDGRILMDIDIGIRHHKAEPVFFLPDGKGIMRFEVVYSEDGFWLK